MATKGIEKQDGVSSPLLFWEYKDGLLVSFYWLGIGCCVFRLHLIFEGIFALVDDLVSLALAPCAIRRMLQLYDEFTNDKHTSFKAKTPRV